MTEGAQHWGPLCNDTLKRTVNFSYTLVCVIINDSLKL